MNWILTLTAALLAAAALIKITGNIIKRKKVSGIKNKIKNFELPENSKGVKAYEYFASHSPADWLRASATGALFKYYRKKYAAGGDKELLKKALYCGETIRHRYPDRHFFENTMFELGNLYYFEKFDFRSAGEVFKELTDTKPSSRWRSICDVRTRLINDNMMNGDAMKLYSTAEKCFENSRFRDAAEYLNKIVEKYPESEIAGTALFFLGDIHYYKYGDGEKALYYYRRVHENFPYHRSAGNAYYKTGEILRKNRRWGEAIKVYRSYIKNYPESPYRDDAYFYIGECYQNLNKPRAAKNSYSLILGDYPDSKWTDVIYHRIQELNRKIEKN